MKLRGTILQKVLGTGGVLVAAALVLASVLVALGDRTLSRALDRELKEVAQEETSKIAENVRTMCQITNELLKSRVETALGYAKEIVHAKGGISASTDKVSWDAVNQFTQEKKVLELPKMSLGSDWLGKVTSFEQKVPMIDDVTRALPGNTVTIFQRMNEEGDMLRIATSVPNDRGQRALSTYIPARMPDGTENPVLKLVLRDQTYRGRAWVVNAWYITVYQALKDKSGKIIGMLYAGVHQDAVFDLRKELQKIPVGKSGYVYVVGTTGAERGQYIVSLNGVRDGENIWDAKDSNGRHFIRSIVEKAVATEGTKVDFEFYPWLNQGETAPREKIAAVTLFEPWGWAIGAGAYVDDYKGTTDRIQAVVYDMLTTGGLVAGAVLLLLGLGSVVLVRQMTSPLAKIARASECVSRGDFNCELDTSGTDEVADAARAIDALVRNVHVVVDDVNDLLGSVREGRLDYRVDTRRHEGAFRELIEGMNGMLDAVSQPVAVTARYLDRVEKGDLPSHIPETFPGDFGQLKDSLEAMLGALKTLDREITTTTEQQTRGYLSARCRTEGLSGAYRGLAQGVNASLEGVIQPVLRAIELIKAYAAGDLSKEMPRLENEQAVLSDAVNGIRSNVRLLIGDVDALVKLAVDGNLTARAPVDRHRGDYQKILHGMNRTLDAVTEPINEAQRVLRALSQYDLTARMQGAYRGAHAQIKEALNTTAAALEGALQQVAQTAHQVSSSSTQIASSAQSVAEGSSEQAAALEETSASLEEMSSKTQKTVESTTEAKRMANQAHESAQQGRDVIAQMVDAMDRIRAAAEGTAQIIRDINDIAFQTNLLALNAAVEAARAGDAGRGFAVVAEEVRNLALRSKEAAAKTEALIKESVSLSTEGGTMSGAVHASFNEIVGAVDNVRSVVESIAETSLQQAMGIEQVNRAVSEMDRVVQQAAASAEQSASAAEEMAGQAQRLQDTVERFHLRSSSDEVRSSRRSAQHSNSNSHSNSHSNSNSNSNANGYADTESDPDAWAFTDDPPLATSDVLHS